ncbi:GTPase [Sulfobacillus harzensis]|uniref:GTP-binding protein HSR1 n=1 Tax=Sulfobacillus harzensis TaxID=2729629 RepID=A0A7Y0Q1H3_9FIRM|nr:GTP-binding protein HSR1 [Sulfobacillus harzensis]
MELCVIGKPNVGKTLLLINFAAYLGLREIHLEVEDEGGAQRVQRLGLDRARRDLVSLYAPKTTRVQCLHLELPLGRQRPEITAVDTPGIPEGIADDPDRRHQVALAIERAMRAELVVHVLDAGAAGTRRPEAPGLFDAALVEWGRTRPGYLLVANKMDKPGSQDGLRLIKERFRGGALIPASAITRRGFRDLKGWTQRMLV